jgi:hypothetical protein
MYWKKAGLCESAMKGSGPKRTAALGLGLRQKNEAVCEGSRHQTFSSIPNPPHFRANRSRGERQYGRDAGSARAQESSDDARLCAADRGQARQVRRRGCQANEVVIPIVMLRSLWMTPHGLLTVVSCANYASIAALVVKLIAVHIRLCLAF